jgi:acetyltransferase
LGDLADADVGDFLDLLANHTGVKAIVMYLESILNLRIVQICRPRWR